MPAWNALVGSVGVEDNAPVRQVTRLEAVDIVRRPRNLPHAGAVDVHLKDFPVGCIGLGEQEFVRIPVEVDIADEATAYRFVERGVFSRGRFNDADFIVVDLALQRGIAFMVGGKPQVFQQRDWRLISLFVCGLRHRALNAENLHALKHRIGLDRLA